MCTECVVVFPDGVNVLPWMLCGTNEIGEATAEKMKIAHMPLVNTITDDAIRQLAEHFKVTPREGFLKN